MAFVYKRYYKENFHTTNKPITFTTEVSKKTIHITKAIDSFNYFFQTFHFSKQTIVLIFDQKKSLFYQQKLLT